MTRCLISSSSPSPSACSWPRSPPRCRRQTCTGLGDFPTSAPLRTRLTFEGPRTEAARPRLRGGPGSRHCALVCGRSSRVSPSSRGRARPASGRGYGGGGHTSIDPLPGDRGDAMIPARGCSMRVGGTTPKDGLHKQEVDNGPTRWLQKTMGVHSACQTLGAHGGAAGSRGTHPGRLCVCGRR
jgi:hypothetical protein